MLTCTFTEILYLLIMATELSNPPNDRQPSAPPNTPQPSTQQGNAPQSVNGTAEHSGQAEMTPSSDNPLDQAATLVDNYMTNASNEDKRFWTSDAHNGGGH
jgi:hypothetical protein